MPNDSRVIPAGEPHAEYTLGVPEVAGILGVDPKTIRVWADTGRLHCWRTPGGHRRFRRADVDALLPHRAEAS